MATANLTTINKRVMLVGDTHGDTAWWVRNIIPAAVRYECYTILQLGDFGLWTHTKEGVRYMARLSRALRDAHFPLELYFIDGNHENFDHLKLWVGEGAERLSPAPITDTITYLPRGCVIEIDDVKFMACGGAYSIDKPGRIPGESWWEEEMITDKDVSTCKSQGKVDVVLSHDAPFRYQISNEHAAAKMFYPETLQNRDRLTKVVLAARPKLVVHGHWHAFVDTVQPLMDPMAPDASQSDGLRDVRILGLDCNRRAMNMAVLELPSLTVTTIG